MRFASVVASMMIVSIVQSAFGGLAWETKYREMQVPANQAEVLADFRFKNTGGSPMEITSIQTSCGCTTARVDKKQFAPGEEGVVHVRFDVGGRKGEQVKGVVVKTSDKTKESLVLRMVIQESVSISQKEFLWSSGSVPQAKESMIEVEPEAGAKILGVESLNDQFDARLEEVDPGRRYRLFVTPHSTQVPVATVIKIQVADPKKRWILLQARVED